MKVKSESEVGQLCPTLRDPMDCSLAGSSVHGIFQARVLEWGAIAFPACSPSILQLPLRPSGHLGVVQYLHKGLFSLSPSRLGTPLLYA